MKLLPVVILLSFLLSACQDDPRIRRVLDEADRKIMTMPDSAAVMLESLDVSAASASQRARHALLLTKARHKAHIIETDDSLIKTASDYYRGSGDSLEVQSLFYNGVILKYQKEYPEALIYLMEAADRAAATGDDFYRGMACREQASVYTELDNYDRSAQLGNEAADAFTRAGYPLHAAWERVYIPQSLAYSGKVDEAYDTIKALAADSIIMSDNNLRKYFYFFACNVCFMKKDYKQSEKYFESLINAGDTPSSKLLSQMARLKLLNGDGDISAARQFQKLATELQENESDSLAALSVLAEIYESEGDYKNAYILNMSMQDSIANMVNKRISHPYTTLLNNYFRTEATRKSIQLDESTRRTKVWTMISIALLIIIILSVYIYRHRLRQKDLEREILIRDLSRLEAHVSEISAISPGEAGNKHDNNQFLLSVLKSICDWQSILYIRDRKSEGFCVKVCEILYALTNNENITALEKYIDENFDNLMSRFRQQVPSLNDRQLRIAVFVFLGFSDTTIASLFHDSNASVIRQVRYRIRKKIKEHPTPDTDLFLSYF